MKWVALFPTKALALAGIAAWKLARRVPSFTYAQRAEAAIFWEMTCRQIEEDERHEAARACGVNANGGLS
jgi:hypothetical protein